IGAWRNARHLQQSALVITRKGDRCTARPGVSPALDVRHDVPCRKSRRMPMSAMIQSSVPSLPHSAPRRESIRSPVAALAPTRAGLGDRALRRALAFIDANLGERISLTTLAAAAGI